LEGNAMTRDGVRFRIALAGEEDREKIYRIRHRVYAEELGQHPCNSECLLSDRIDSWNLYIAGSSCGMLLGFISITPPGSPSFSIDKYFRREDLPFAFDTGLFEVRLLTVVKKHRGRELAALLMYAALRWIEEHGGQEVVAIGRREILSLYRKAGLKPLGRTTRSGAVDYELMGATIGEMRLAAQARRDFVQRSQHIADWQLGIPLERPSACYHGGAFFEAIGPSFDRLERAREVINADVLDAWFPPAPGALAALREHLPWLARTSPPSACDGLIEAISRTRGVPSECLVPGSGSSDLIYRALLKWLTPASRVLLLEPTYGEYAHVLERVIGCRIERLPLSRADGYRVDCERLLRALSNEPDLAILVNPNSPTGQHVARSDLEAVLRKTSKRTRVWVDEAYIDYVGEGETLEQFSAASANIVVCKSLSKVYALSGLRVAYLVCPRHLANELRSLTPPWIVSLPGQVAAVEALKDPQYYAGRYSETRQFRKELREELNTLTSLMVLDGTANFLLCSVKESAPDVATILRACRRQNLFLRDATAFGPTLGRRAFRIAVKDRQTNHRMVAILRASIEETSDLFA
jgi:histidinol-phosphate/aromatic aminotransferase/cobyric acid decarboxylase-like protein/GNAT superfamily N-acetyltransferase